MALMAPSRVNHIHAASTMAYASSLLSTMDNSVCLTCLWHDLGALEDAGHVLLSSPIVKLSNAPAAMLGSSLPGFASVQGSKQLPDPS